MRRRLALLALLSACASSTKTTGPALPKPAETPATADEVRAAALDSYLQLAQGYDSVFLESVAKDERVVFLGVRPGDIVVGYDATPIIKLHRLFEGDALDLVSKDLDVHLSADKTAAWVSDELSYRSLHGQRRAFLPLRRSAVYERQEGRWFLVMEHLSYPAPDGMAARVARAVPPAIGGGEEGQAIRQRIVGVISGADDSSVTIDDASFVFGPRGERARGRAVGKMATPAAFFPDAGSIDVVSLRVAVSKSGTVAWALASLAVGGPRGQAARASFVLEKRGGIWWIVQTHVSRPVTGETLAADLGLGGD